MRTYVRVQDGAVAEILSTDRDISAMFHPALIWVDVTEAAPAPQSGWTFDGKDFHPPLPPQLTLEQQAALAFGTGCQVVSAANPALNGVYAIDNVSESRITAIETGINAGKGLPGGGATFPYPDMTGTPHSFSQSDFTNFAAAIRDYVFALVGAQSGQAALPSQPVSIP